MRILHLADRLTDRGGAYTWLLGIVEALAPDHDVRLAVGAVQAGLAAPCAVDVIPGLGARTACGAALEGAAGWANVIHLHNITNPAVLEWAAARPGTLLTVQDHRFFCPSRGKWTLDGQVCRLPLVRADCRSCFEDEAYFREVHTLTERRLAAARRLPLTVLSRYMREELVAAGVPPANVRVVPAFVHGLDPHAPPSGPPCVLFVGRLAEAKGVAEAISAWRLSGVGLPLVLAGSGPLREGVAGEASRDGAGLELPGWVDRARLSGFYRRASALLMPSRWQEPFGIVGIEALSFGVPVVAWDSGGVREWHPGPGLAPWGDVSALAASLRDAIGRRVTMPPRFERSEAVGRLLALYAAVAGG